MKQNIKFILTGFLVAALIFGGAFAIFLLPEIFSDDQEVNIMDLEIGKFPGEKYTTFFHNTKTTIGTDTYDPLENRIFATNYMLGLTNIFESTHTIVFEGKEYPVRYMASSEQVTAPYVWFDMIDRTLLYNRIDVWTDTGKIKAVYFNEEYADRTYDLSDEARIKKANELVAKYAPQINLALYDVGHINSQNCVYYSLKAGYFGYQLAYEKHIKVFFKDDRVLCFDFGYDQDSLSGLLWDEVLVEEAVRQKATTLENENWKCTDIKLVEVDICKYGVPVVRSEVTFVFTQSGEKRVINFYTKISD